VNISKEVKLTLGLVAIVIAGFVIYGFVTDCPNTSGYFFCSESERRDLRD
jgi:hypothetical protein